MPITPTYPGVYIEEVSSGVRTITPVATSRTVFIGRTSRGPQDDATQVQSFSEFERNFGGLDVQLSLPYAVQQFFDHGGTDALIVRVVHEDGKSATAAVNGLPLKASGAGKWGNNLRARIDHDVKPGADGQPRNDLFNLFLQDSDSKIEESFRNLSIDPDDARYFETVLEQQSQLVRSNKAPDVAAIPTPGAHPPIPADGNRSPFGAEDRYTKFNQDGEDGSEITDQDILGDELSKTGYWALERWEKEFNLFVVPPLTRTKEVSAEALGTINKYCAERRALLLVDAPSDWKDVATASTQIDTLRSNISIKKNAAIFFPRLKMPDSKRENRTAEFPASGAVAGIFARTDATRGVWKSPAGIEATFNGVSEFSVKMSDAENGRLNPLGINCLRNLPGGIGNVVWGSRTLDGSDRLASEWKYLAVRRVALFLEESLYQGTQWVVFEPNDEPLWSQIRLNIGAFMHGLFRQGAFQGRSPREAYFVRCDKTTTTQNDINRGIVNIEVGFAPLKPAEFVILKISQIAGEIET